LKEGAQEHDAYDVSWQTVLSRKRDAAITDCIYQPGAAGGRHYQKVKDQRSRTVRDTAGARLRSGDFAPRVAAPEL
jgi:hypothetical protein